MELGSNTININVGLIGHVDSGKTSLAKALSTIASTAAFDKHKQSQERGITLDLGFSAFHIVVDQPIIQRHPHLEALKCQNIQITLVDCPGHASLVRTIIGGSQIIDLMVLLIDAQKGMQTQSAEGLVIGEITTDKLIVAINKCDLIPTSERDSHLKKLRKRLSKTFAQTKFSAAPLINVSADPEEDAPTGIQEIIDSILENVAPRHPPNPDDEFLFSIDHCFGIKGQGTILTGTVIQGQVCVNETIELPEHKMRKKVKSMQMFKQPVQSASQGDRVGICVTQLDPKIMERGWAAQPDALVFVEALVTCVSKVRFFKDSIESGKKFHVSIGHDTVMASIILYVSALNPSGAKGKDEESGFSDIDEYLYLDNFEDAPENVNVYALLKLEHPILCPKHAILIGSRLDYDVNTSQCRVAFHGYAEELIKDYSVTSSLKIFKEKMREGEVDRWIDDHACVGMKLFNADVDMNGFVGLKVVLEPENVDGTIIGSFGKGKQNKFKVEFSETVDDFKHLSDAHHKSSQKLVFRYKKYVFDPKKKFVQ